MLSQLVLSCCRELCECCECCELDLRSLWDFEWCSSRRADLEQVETLLDFLVRYCELLLLLLVLVTHLLLAAWLLSPALLSLL